MKRFCVAFYESCLSTGGKEALHRPPPQTSGQIFKDDINGCSSISDFCFMLLLQGEGEQDCVVSKTDFIQFAVVPLKL
jgi:hypothetical protein